MLRCMALTTASGPPKSSFLRSCLIAQNKGLNLENRVIGEQLKYPSGRDSCVSDEEWWRALSILKREVSLMYSIIEFASIVGIMETKNLLGLDVNATRTMHSLFVCLDFTLVGFIAFLPIQTLPLYVCGHKNQDSSSII